MVKIFNNLFLNEEKVFIIGIALILFFPLITFFRNFFLNFYLICCCIYFIYLILSKKINTPNFLTNPEIKILFIFFFFLIINLFINNPNTKSFISTIGFLRFIIFIPMVIFFISYKNFKFLNLYLNFWSFIFVLLSVDLLIEFSRGKNIFGFESGYPGRLAGMMGDELVIGFFYYCFFLIIGSHIIKKINYNFLSIFFILFFLVIFFLIGERANFLRGILCLIFIFTFIKNTNLKKKIFISLLTILLLMGVSYSSKYFKGRYFDALIKPVISNPVNFIKQSHHGAHYDVATKIFNNNRYFGIGLKNFRHECKKEKYFNEQFKMSKIRCSTHPHQIHLELLSELGLIIYFIFILFIFVYLKSQYIYFKKNNNFLLLCSSLTVGFYFLLPLPTGSFFTSYTSSLFWFILGISMAFRKLKS